LLPLLPIRANDFRFPCAHAQDILIRRLLAGQRQFQRLGRRTVLRFLELLDRGGHVRQHAL
jgi:hypothetical protein